MNPAPVHLSPEALQASRALVERRVLELVYTSCDLQPFARALGYDGPPFRWDPEQRFRLRCELDARFFLLYGSARDDAQHIMDSFPVVRRHDEKRYGCYRTQLRVLGGREALARATAQSRDKRGP